MMYYLTTYETNIGTTKKINQDSMLLKQAETSLGNVVFAAVCDGMGGLCYGEIASKEVIVKLNDWFEQKFPNLLKADFSFQKLQEQWSKIIQDVNERVSRFGKENGIKMGTTATGLLIIDDNYYVFHVGDTRVYCFGNGIKQITQDHSFVQSQIMNGRLNKEQARNHPKRNLLLQAVGTDEHVMIDFCDGNVKEDDLFLICSDGFRNKVYEEEMFDFFQNEKIENEKVLNNCLQILVQENLDRLEKDNITVIAIKEKSKNVCVH